MEGKSRLRLVAFDMDGTLVDDEWAHTEANRLIAQELGLTLEKEKPGFSVRAGWERRLAREGIRADVEAIVREHFRRTLELVEKARIPAAPGLDAALQRLCPGEQATCIFPSHLAYGMKGHGQAVPPYTPVVLRVEVEAHSK